MNFSQALSVSKEKAETPENEQGQNLNWIERKEETTTGAKAPQGIIAIILKCRYDKHAACNMGVEER